MKREVEYFSAPGPGNTEASLNIAAGLAGEGIRDFVVASTTGATGVRAAESLAGLGVNLVVVGHSVGFKGPNQDEFQPEHKARIEALGGRVFRGTILTHSLETGLAGAFGGSYPTLLVANTLRRLGQGIKVACEIVMEACDAGLIPEDVETAAVAGTGRGADTVALIRSKASKRFLELVVLEILAKPRG
ncbi:MAG: hypothetical protein KKB20_20675 [Proteobacteria bacterium]|nr:hypothetical protein [Pseudomonadota bacterium]